jgi:hypothetical protein
MTITSKREITEAKGYLERNCYEVSIHNDGHLIVQKPIRVSGCDGRLITCGSRPVAIRDFDAAIRFVHERN